MIDGIIQEAHEHRRTCHACLVGEMLDGDYCGQYYHLYATAEVTLLSEMEPPSDD